METRCRLGHLAGSLLLLAGCAHHPKQYALTEHSKSFSAMDASQANLAPPVTESVTGARIAAARAEPQNWLTYYGAYDGPPT